jgi:hypothetical protein
VTALHSYFKKVIRKQDGKMLIGAAVDKMKKIGTKTLKYENALKFLLIEKFEENLLLLSNELKKVQSGA